MVDDKSGALLVFSYNVGDKSYSTYSITPGAASVPRGRLVITGNVWTYPWHEIDKGKTTYFRVLNVFTAPDTIEFRQEYLTDRAHWTRTATEQEHRLRPVSSPALG